MGLINLGMAENLHCSHISIAFIRARGRIDLSLSSDACLSVANHMGRALGLQHQSWSSYHSINGHILDWVNPL